LPRSGDLSWGSIQPPWWEISQPSWNEDKLLRGEPECEASAAPQRPRMAACWGVWGSWLGPAPGTTLPPKHWAPNSSGCIVGWPGRRVVSSAGETPYSPKRARHAHSRTRGYMRPRLSGCMLLKFLTAPLEIRLSVVINLFTHYCCCVREIGS